MFSPRPSSPSPLPAKRGQRWSVVVGCTYEKKKRAWLVNRTKGWARKEIFSLLTPRHPSNWWMTKYNFIPSRSIKLQNYPATSALRLLALRSKRNFKSEREKTHFSPHKPSLSEAQLSEHVYFSPPFLHSPCGSCPVQPAVCCWQRARLHWNIRGQEPF